MDTGCDLTAVSPRIITSLNVRAGQRLSTHTAGGVVRVRTYFISLSIPPVAGVASPLLVIPRLRVTQLAASLPGHEVLIGLDIILQYQLNIDGPGQQFTLVF
jgi:hypothetical protein